MPKVTQYISAIGSALGELSALYTVYEQLEAPGKTFIDNELAAIKTEFSTVKTALDNFASASTVGKISAGISLLSIFGDVITFVETTYKNGETMLASDWPVVKQHLDNLLAIFTNIGASSTATPAIEPTTAAAGV